EDVQEAEQRAPARAEVVLDRRRVDAWRRDPGAEAVEREDEEREQDATPQLRDAPGVREPREHPLLLAFLGRLDRLVRCWAGLCLLDDVVVEVGGDRLPRLHLRLALDGLTAQPGNRTTGCFDLLPRRLRESMRRDGELLRQ